MSITLNTPCVEATYLDYSFGNDGYPRKYCKRRKNTTSAITVLWEEKYGPIPEGHELDHLCRNKICINLDHIDVVTSVENNRRAHAKLTAKQVMRIKSRLLLGETKASLSRRFSVSYMTITFIERGRTWADIPPTFDDCPVNHGMGKLEECCTHPDKGCWAGSN